MLGGIGVQEIVIILIVGLLVFGAARLPKIARSLGQGIKEFKKTVKGLDEDDEPAEKTTKYVQQPPSYPQQYPPAGGQAQQQYGPQGGTSPQGTGPVQDQQPPQGQYGAGAPGPGPQNAAGGPPPGTEDGEGKKA